MAKSTHKKSSQKRTMRSKHTKRQTKKVRRNRKKTKKSNLKGGNNNKDFYQLAKNNNEPLYNTPAGLTGSVNNIRESVLSKNKKRYNIINVSNHETVRSGLITRKGVGRHVIR
jgi:hypothetical protein